MWTSAPLLARTLPSAGVSKTGDTGPPPQLVIQTSSQIGPLWAGRGEGWGCSTWPGSSLSSAPPPAAFRVLTEASPGSWPFKNGGRAPAGGREESGPQLPRRRRRVALTACTDLSARERRQNVGQHFYWRQRIRLGTRWRRRGVSWRHNAGGEVRCMVDAMHREGVHKNAASCFQSIQDVL